MEKKSASWRTAKWRKKRIEKLKEVINYHRYLYHVLNKEELSPEALDSLKHELYNLEKENPEFITLDSPTQRVEGNVAKGFLKVEHRFPMLSIEDIFSQEELKDWENYLKRLIPFEKIEYFTELKIDGFAVSLIYKNGIFFKGATRGDGKTGEDITQNLKTIESVPLKLFFHKNLKTELKEIEENFKKIILKGEIEVRGEVYMEKKDFENFNEERRKKEEEPYANPRNLAAGSIRQLDSKLVAKRPLKFLAYDLITDTGQKKHSTEHQILPILGFKTDQGKKCKNIEEIISFWQEIKKNREKLPFQIDGIVISVDDNFVFKKLGIAGKSPRGIRAFKFSPKQAATQILDIKIQIGRTGVATPVAFLKPVQVSGTLISRATLHNEDQIKRLRVRIGDTVIIERAGDVIPAVVKVLPKLRSGSEKEFKMPEACPICSARLIKKKDEVLKRCPNLNCQARKRELFYHFASKKAFNIKGLGPKIIDKLMDEKLISRISDIFTLNEGDLLPLERFAEKSAKNLILSIQKSKTVSLAKFIYSLGIFHVGEETAICLADFFGGINELIKASKEDLKKIPDVGQEVSKSIFNWFLSKNNLNLIRELIAAGIKILPLEKTEKDLAGKTFILTGTLKNITRFEAEKKIRLLGGHPLNSVSRATDFLVLGENPGSKLEKARRFGVKIIDEKEFLKMLKF
ncbi:MAG: NAD-dependent DNA ligase LigA [Candidatus Nealsonbacteria bacterium]|nr:NAD-dependent DNA ligase LigA [Candidatus Nealsonbacteria bacterium]